MKIFYQRFVLPITGKQHKYKESALEDNSPFQAYFLVFLVLLSFFYLIIEDLFTITAGGRGISLQQMQTFETSLCYN